MGGLWTSVGLGRSAADAMRVVQYRGGAFAAVNFETTTGTVSMGECWEGREYRSLANYLGSWIAFDGCIYNDQELRLALAPMAGEYGLHRPAQITLAAVQKWGLECLTRLDGAFAFVLWEANKGKLTAVRDAFGMKPLYLRMTAAGIAFASEIKQFFASSDVARELNIERASDFLVYGLTDHSIETMIQGVYAIPPGSTIEIDIRCGKRESRPPRIAKWYQLPLPDSLEATEGAAVDEFRNLLFHSVKSRAHRPGRGALCLSGGLDSAAIAAILAKGGELENFISLKAWFGEPEFDEPNLLNSVLERTSSRCYLVHCDGEHAFNVLDALLWHMEEPFGRASLAAQWLLTQQAACMGLNFTLDGQGADEQLAGYGGMVDEARAYANGGWNSPASVGSHKPTIEFHHAHLHTPPIVEAWLSAEFYMLSRDFAAQAFRMPRNLGQICHDRILTGDLPMMMRQNDRIGMAHRIETHVPFMERRLVEFCIRLGAKFKIVRNETKYLLRRAMNGLVPQIVLDPKPKGSYSELEAKWLRGRCWKRLAFEVRNTTAEWPQLFQAKAVDALLTETPAADKQTLLFLWRIAIFGAWARRFAIVA
jgi:asparagine synthase (glutamine-hydrolysing)